MNKWPDKLPDKKKSVNDDDLTEIKEDMQIDKKNQCAATQLDMEAADDAMEPDANKLDMEAEHEDEEKLSVDEHGSFVQVLQSVLKSVKSHFQALCTILI